MQKTIDSIIKVCGIGTTCFLVYDISKYLNIITEYGLHTSCTSNLGITSYINSFIFEPSSKESNLGTGNIFDLLILEIADNINVMVIDKLLFNIRNLARQYAFILNANNDNIRETIEKISLKYSMRKHPRSMRVYSFECLEQTSDHKLLFMENLPANVEYKYPLETLKNERDLHMDMFREFGRRSDAHLVRYFEAAKYVPFGANILDCACGLGYGAYIIYNNSQASRILGIDISPETVAYANINYGIFGKVSFLTGDAETLENIPNDSMDFITSFETLEHLPEPLFFLKRLSEILREGGRIMLSVPHKWPVPENSKPPYHVQMYDYHRLIDEVSEYFAIEKVFLEIAGQSGRWQDRKRTWEEMPIGHPLPYDPEWLLLLGYSLK